MDAVIRLVVMLLAGVAMVTVYVAYQRMVNATFSGQRNDFTAEEIAAGEHCRQQFSTYGSPLRTALETRMGNNLDDRVKLNLRDVDLGPMQPNGTRRLVALYSIDRLGDRGGSMKKATGTLLTSDCSVTISVFQN